MPATLLGEVGSWGIASDELDNGIIVESIDETSKNQKNWLRDKVGQRTGRADYDESVEIVIKGKVTAATPFSQKLSDDLVLSNLITSTHLQAAAGGRTLIDEVQKGAENEGWKGITVNAELLPFMGADA
jgi:hypothetical protein